MNTVESVSGMPPAPALARTVELDHEQSLPLADARSARIKVIYGCVWVSGAGKSSDYLIGSEEAVVRVPRGSVVRSIGRTRIEVIEGQRMRRLRYLPEKVRRWLRLPPVGARADQGRE